MIQIMIFSYKVIGVILLGTGIVFASYITLYGRNNIHANSQANTSVSPTSEAVFQNPAFTPSFTPSPTGDTGGLITTSYQNYGWYMHDGKNMQYVDGSWYDSPQQDKSRTQGQTTQQTTQNDSSNYNSSNYVAPTLYIPPSSSNNTVTIPITPVPTVDNTAAFQACNDAVYARYNQQISSCNGDASCQQGVGQDEASGLNVCHSTYGM